jgi:hypothetical protein
MLRSLSVTLALLLPLTGVAKIQPAPLASYTGLNFTVAGGVPIGYTANCTTLGLDVTGDISGTRRFAVNGTFTCGSFNNSYAVTGAGYLTTTSTVNMTLQIGLLAWVCNLNSTTFNGTCSVLAYTPQTLGTLTLTFVP